ncbi:MAG: histone deacetylase [Deltaproteobacteria bacterium]|nr:histone deacetylase [Deltaproteobacteria bacterium]
MKTGIVRDDRYINHGHESHPESPRRLQSVHAMVDSPEMASLFVRIPPRYASEEELRMVHTKSYIEEVAATEGQGIAWLDPDTQTSEDSFQTAKLAVGGVLNAVDAVVGGKVNNAFALVRPPGHHSHSRRAAGFCLFNNVALAAQQALKKHKLERVLIVDWDLHHGDGTQDTFYESNSVLFFSSHQYPYYPGSGALQEVGNGDGLGYTINVPLATGAGNAEYLKIYQQLLVPATLAFKPELIIVSAGFDTYFMDPLGGMKVTTEGYAYLTRMVMDLAKVCCKNRLLVVLEGGYHLQGLTASIKAVLLELKEETKTQPKMLEMIASGASSDYDAVISKVKDKLCDFWYK